MNYARQLKKCGKKAKTERRNGRTLRDISFAFLSVVPLKGDLQTIVGQTNGICIFGPSQVFLNKCLKAQFLACGMEAVLVY